MSQSDQAAPVWLLVACAAALLADKIPETGLFGTTAGRGTQTRQEVDRYDVVPGGRDGREELGVLLSKRVPGCVISYEMLRGTGAPCPAGPIRSNEPHTRNVGARRQGALKTTMVRRHNGENRCSHAAVEIY